MLLTAMPEAAFAAEHWVGLDHGAPPPACGSKSDSTGTPAKTGLLADDVAGQLVDRGSALPPNLSPSARGGASNAKASAEIEHRCEADAQVAQKDAVPFTAMAAKLARLAAAPRMPLIAGRLSSGFGLRLHPLLAEVRMHSGVDLAAPLGSPVFATDRGVISSAGWQGGYGLAVAIEHPSGLQTRYGHMSRLNVVAGQRVEMGQIVGFVGSTGLSTGPHLHYEVRFRGQAINPLSVMSPLLGAASGTKSAIRR